MQSITQAEEAGADMLELRIDYLEDITPAHLEMLIHATNKPVIVTPRLASEGGHWQSSEAERFEYLHQAVALGADYIDVEFRATPQLRDDLIAHKRNSQVIISYHNFQETESLAALWRIFQEQMDLGADIGKIATMANSEADTRIIRNLLGKAGEAHQACIALCMGEQGMTSRVHAPEWGSFLTFAALDHAHASAPGQLTIDDLIMIWSKKRIFSQKG